MISNITAGSGPPAEDDRDARQATARGAGVRSRRRIIISIISIISIMISSSIYD